MNVWSERDHALTGRARVRPGIEKIDAFHKRPVLIAQVEETCIRYLVHSPEGKAHQETRWRDLRTTDLPLPPFNGERR